MESYQLLESKWAEFNGLEPANMVACSSGTAALHLALESLRLPAGSRVIVPDYTMIACANAVLFAGLTPEFADCDDRMLVDLGAVPGTRKVVMPVHVYGRRCGDRVWDWASRTGATVVEDLAEAHGIRPRPESYAACWSFYKNKIVAGEEGGAVWFKDREVADYARLLRCQGFTPEHDYNHVPRGHNYRLANCLAEQILGYDEDGSWVGHTRGLPWVGDNMKKKRQVELWYDEVCPAEWRMPARDVVWVYDVWVPGWGWQDVRKAVKQLNEVGIQARCGFVPMSSQAGLTMYPKYGGRNAYDIGQGVLYLPADPSVKREQTRRAFEVLEQSADKS